MMSWLDAVYILIVCVCILIIGYLLIGGNDDE